MSEEVKENEAKELESGLAQMDQIRAQIESLRSQKDSLASVIEEYKTSIEIVEEMERGISDDILIPVGGAVLLSAKLTDTEKLTVDVGSGIHVKMGPKEAREKIENRKGSVEKAVETIDSRLGELMERYQSLSARTQELYSSQMSQGQGPEGSF